MIINTTDDFGKYTFECSGRSFKTYSPYIGLSIYTTNDGEKIVAEGYDGFIEINDERISDQENLSAEEKKELAVFMIKQWKQFGDL